MLRIKRISFFFAKNYDGLFLDKINTVKIIKLHFMVKSDIKLPVFSL